MLIVKKKKINLTQPSLFKKTFYGLKVNIKVEARLTTHPERAWLDWAA